MSIRRTNVVVCSAFFPSSSDRLQNRSAQSLGKLGNVECNMQNDTRRRLFTNDQWLCTCQADASVNGNENVRRRPTTRPFWTFEDYRSACRQLAAVLGKTHLVQDLSPTDFRRLRAEVSKKLGLRRSELGSNAVAATTTLACLKRSMLDLPVAALGRPN